MPINIGLAADPGDIVEGYGIHDCCCEHVVEAIDAMPATSSQERYEHREVARDRYFECPHQWLTPLEVYLGTLS